jgi:succinyl-CoA synthetase beta subunit
MYVEVATSYLTPTMSTPEVVNVGAVKFANFVDAGHVMAADPAFVNRMYTTSAMLVPSVFVNAMVVAPVIVIVNSVAAARFNVWVPETEPSADTK